MGTGWAPFGYRFTRAGERNRVVGLEPDPETAPVVRRIFRELVTTPVNTLCNHLNAEGIPTMFAGKKIRCRGKAEASTPHGWTNGTILGIVANPIYLGTAA